MGSFLVIGLIVVVAIASASSGRPKGTLGSVTAFGSRLFRPRSVSAPATGSIPSELRNARLTHSESWLVDPALRWRGRTDQVYATVDRFLVVVDNKLGRPRTVSAREVAQLSLYRLLLEDYAVRRGLQLANHGYIRFVTEDGSEQYVRVQLVGIDREALHATLDGIRAKRAVR